MIVVLYFSCSISNGLSTFSNSRKAPILFLLSLALFPPLVPLPLPFPLFSSNEFWASAPSSSLRGAPLLAAHEAPLLARPTCDPLRLTLLLLWPHPGSPLCFYGLTPSSSAQDANLPVPTFTLLLLWRHPRSPRCFYGLWTVTHSLPWLSPHAIELLRSLALCFYCLYDLSPSALLSFITPSSSTIYSYGKL